MSDDSKTDDVFVSVHARGFPYFGPETMCGEGSLSSEPMTEVTCPACLEVFLEPYGLVKRIRKLEESGIKVDIEAARRCSDD